MWKIGVSRGRQSLPGEFNDLIRHYAETVGQRRHEPVAPAVIEVPAFHGFRAIAATRRPGTKRIISFRS